MTAAGLFGAGTRTVVSPLATTMQAAPLVMVDTNLRCSGEHRGRRCGMLQMERAARPWSWTCPRCGFHNGSSMM